MDAKLLDILIHEKHRKDKEQNESNNTNYLYLESHEYSYYHNNTIEKKEQVESKRVIEIQY